MKRLITFTSADGDPITISVDKIAGFTDRQDATMQAVNSVVFIDGGSGYVLVREDYDTVLEAMAAAFAPKHHRESEYAKYMERWAEQQNQTNERYASFLDRQEAICGSLVTALGEIKETLASLTVAPTEPAKPAKPASASRSRSTAKK